LRHFGLREFFYSQIRVHVVPLAHPHRRTGEVTAPPSPLWPSSPSPSSYSYSSNPAAFLRATAAHTGPVILLLALLALFLGMQMQMHNDIGRLRTSLDDRSCGAPHGPNWANAPVPPVTVTATTTVVSHHQYQQPTPRATNVGADAEWDDEAFESEAGYDDASVGAEAPRSAPTLVTMIDITSPASGRRERVRPPSGDSRSAHGEHNALLAIERLPLLWPIRLELPFTREQALEAVEHGLGVAWQILRRLYHFPLDPP
jgi:hypothetical protein